MSLRNINHQIAIELGHLDTEYVTALKDEREWLYDELYSLSTHFYYTLGARQRRNAVVMRLVRIEELLAK